MPCFLSSALPPLGGAKCVAAAAFPDARRAWLRGAGRCCNLTVCIKVDGGGGAWEAPPRRADHGRGRALPAVPCQRRAPCGLPPPRQCQAVVIWIRSARWGCLPALCTHTVLARDSLCAGCHVICHGTALHSTEFLHMSWPRPEPALRYTTMCNCGRLRCVRCRAQAAAGAW